MEVKKSVRTPASSSSSVRFWGQFLNGGLTTASTENQRFGVLFFFPPNLCSGSANCLSRHAGTQIWQKTPGSWSKVLLPRPLAHLAPRSCATGPPLPQASGCALSPLLSCRNREGGRPEGSLTAAYNKESFVTALSGESRGTRSPFSGNSPLAPGPLRRGTLAKERCPYNCNPVQLLAFPISLEYALCFQSPSIYYV